MWGTVLLSHGMYRRVSGVRNVQICARYVISLRKLDTERGEACNGNFLYAEYIFFFGVSCNFYFSHCFISWFLFCAVRACFFFLVLLSTSSSFLFFCLLLLSCSSVFFFFLFFCLLLLSCSARGCFFFLGFCLVTFCSIKGLVSRVLLGIITKYFLYMNISWPGGCFSVPFRTFSWASVSWSSFFAVWGLGFSGGGTDWLICCNPDCCWGLRAQFPCQKVAMWGLSIYKK